MIEHRITTSASPEVIFAIYADVAKWNTWDPDTKSASINGDFKSGSTGILAPTKGNPIKITFTEVIANRSFTCIGGIPGFQMTFEHELQSQGTNTEIIHRVQFKGILAWLFKPLLGPQINKGLPVTLARLRDLAESRS